MGCGHSGTSLLLRLLGAHSKIHPIAGETGIFMLNSDNNIAINKKLKQFDKEAKQNNAHYWAEKPQNTFISSNKSKKVALDQKL